SFPILLRGNKTRRWRRRRTRYNILVVRIRQMTALPSALSLAIFAASVAFAAPNIFPLKDVRAGQRGVGRTVFAGTRVEEFQVEVLGVLENVGPKQSIILA